MAKKFVARWSPGNITLTGSFPQVLMLIGTGLDEIVEVHEMWMGQASDNDLNQVFSMQIVRLSDNGTGGFDGGGMEPYTVGDLTSVFTTGVDSDSWSIDPTVTAVVGGPHTFNVSDGWHWPKDNSFTRSLIVSPSSHIGFRINANPGAMVYSGGIVFSVRGD